MNSVGKLLITAGGVLVLIGVIVQLAGRANVPLGRLPGDIAYRGKSTAFFFPITTCIILSILLSLIIWLVNRFMR
ncbi:MAG TPA: DUF2905 domain-containing protein [Terriglobales bacterium]|jgi:hypothetical protein|nr:DUF2905 domain-containing protein [Terriglobales bacterium]